MNEMFSKEFLREMNHKRDLILKTQSARLKDRARYLEILAKYEISDGLLYRMRIERLKELVGELEA